MTPVERVLSLLPDAKQMGAGWMARCPAHEDRTPSLSVREAIDGKVLLTCHAGCSLDRIVAALGLTIADLFPNTHGARRSHPRATKSRTPGNVSRLLRDCVADTGRIHDYLKSRGLRGTVPTVLRFHPHLDYFEEGTTTTSFPAMVAPIVTADRMTIGVQRTYLSSTSAGKAPVAAQKKILGQAKGGAVRLVEPETVLALAEGIETALAVTEATGTPCWAILGATNMPAVAVPDGVTTVEIWADPGTKGEEAAAETAAKHHAAGLVVQVMVAPAGTDWLDVLVRDGADALRGARAEATAWVAGAEGENFRPEREPGEDDDVEEAQRKPRTPWDVALSAPDFLRTHEAEVDWYEANLLAPGSITQIFAPRGLGKTHVALHLGVKCARRDLRVLLLDRDNSRREVKRRLGAWGAAETPSFKVLTRDEVPPLTNADAWKTFPFADYDIVIVDSYDSSTEGVGEQDSARPSRALAPMIDIAHRAGGPAILLLGNTVKSDKHSRGAGVVEDRGDLVYEVRDATRFTPSGTKEEWWTELPPGGREAWAERATRRGQRERIRLAFINTKCRIGEEPPPFVLEIDFAGQPWTVTDVTATMLAAGKEAAEQAAKAATEREEAAVAVIKREIAARAAAGKPPLAHTAAVERLRKSLALQLKRQAARDVVDGGDGVHWQLVRFDGKDERPSAPGKPLNLMPLPGSGPPAETRPTAEKPRQTGVFDEPVSAARASRDGTNQVPQKPAPDAGSATLAFVPPEET
jgi:hypothetical protein